MPELPVAPSLGSPQNWHELDESFGSLLVWINKFRNALTPVTPRLRIGGAVVIQTGTTTRLVGTVGPSSGSSLTTGWTIGFTVNPATGIYTVSAAGTYLITGYIAYASSAAGTVRSLSLVRESTPADSSVTGNVQPPAAAANQPSIWVTAIVPFAAGDTFSLQTTQDSGGNLNATFRLDAAKIGN